jgi:addiction module HigA family antidote
MPAKKTKTPGEILISLIQEYQLNPFSLSKEIKINYQTIQNIIKGKGRITVQTALKLGKYFGQPPAYWIDIQLNTDIAELSKDKKFMSSLNSISKVQKPKAAAKTKSKPKAIGKTAKRNTLAEKRKKAAKIPGARPAKGKQKIKS